MSSSGKSVMATTVSGRHMATVVSLGTRTATALRNGASSFDTQVSRLAVLGSSKVGPAGVSGCCEGARGGQTGFEVVRSQGLLLGRLPAADDVLPVVERGDGSVLELGDNKDGVCVWGGLVLADGEVAMEGGSWKRRVEGLDSRKSRSGGRRRE